MAGQPGRTGFRVGQGTKQDLGTEHSRVPSMVRYRTGPSTERGWLIEQGWEPGRTGLSTVWGECQWNREWPRVRGTCTHRVASLLLSLSSGEQPRAREPARVHSIRNSTKRPAPPSGDLRNLLKTSKTSRLLECQNRLVGTFFGKKSKIGLEEKGRFRVNCENLR